MTLQDIERAFELSEKRFQLHEERFARIDETLAYVASQVKEHDRKLQIIEDNLIVQGNILNRVDHRLDQVSERIEGLTTILHSHTSQLALMQSAMTSLFQRMDNFIRGLEGGNGNPAAGGSR